METIELLKNALEYIEENLDAELNIDDIAKIAYSSRYHFQRIFHALTGFTVTRYIRNRRLTLAAEELTMSHNRITDIALKYGYESPEAFAKAFKRMHGMSPSALKNFGGKIKAFPKISFTISIKGEREIVYKIVQKEGFKVFGVSFETTKVNDEAYRDIPKFISGIFENGVHDRINEMLGRPKGSLLSGFHYDFKEDGTRKYMMGHEMVREEFTGEFTVLSVPELTWAVFEGFGKGPDNFIIQDIWRRVYSEWFPSSGFEQVEGPCMEKNFLDDESGYRCELWIPVKRKK